MYLCAFIYFLICFCLIFLFGRYNIQALYMNLLEDKICIHKYLTKCNTNPQPPGFADYLRGTIALYNLSQKYNYKLLMDNDHPLFRYIKQTENVVSNTNLSTGVIELLPPLSYEHIYNLLNEIFSRNKSFIIMTNSFYSITNGNLSNWGEISDECRSYLINILCPTEELNNRIEHITRDVYELKQGDIFKVIHLRFGDKFINAGAYDNSLYDIYYTKISNIINNNPTVKYVLISDLSTIATRLKQQINKLYYWNNEKIHIGDLINNSNSALLDTMTDFFIISKSSEILSNAQSGFSIVASLIYNITYSSL